MQLFTLAFIFGFVCLTFAEHHHGHASSYANVVIHDDHHDQHDHHEHFDHHEHEDHKEHVDYHGHDDHHYYLSHPSYKFEYGVKDSHTGYNKNQWEHRDGDHVKGSYELYEADGTKRVVEYTSDKHGGFHAEVKRIGHAYHPQVYGHHEEYHGHEHEYDHHHGHAESWANSNLYEHHH